MFRNEWEEVMKPGWNFPEVSWALTSRCSPVKARWLTVAVGSLTGAVHH